MKTIRTIFIAVILLLSACVLFACGDDAAETTFKVDEQESEFFAEWQNYIKDDVRLVDAVMPGSHDSGTLNIGNNTDLLNGLTETQGEDIYGQLLRGSRYFDIRVSKGSYKDDEGNKVEALKIFHGVINLGMTFDKVLDDINAFFDEYEGQFLVLDFQHFSGDVEPAVREMFEDKMNPSDYCVKNTEDLGSLTYGDVRESGVRYVVVWGSSDLGDTDYIFPRTSSLISPYDSINHNFGGNYLIENGFPYYYRLADDDKFFVLQAQLTNSVNVEGSVSGTIKELAMLNNVPMNTFVRSLAEESKAALLSKTNIVMRDYLDMDMEKQRASLSLNLAKNTVAEEYVNLFKKMTDKLDIEV